MHATSTLLVHCHVGIALQIVDTVYAEQLMLHQ